MGRRYRKYSSGNYYGKRNYRSRRTKPTKASFTDMIGEAVAMLAGFFILLVFFTKTGWIWLLLAVLFGIGAITLNICKYRQGAYYQNTKNSYLTVLFDPGKYGEYLTYRHLKHLEADGAKFLFNTYIPKGADATTEIDVLMISKKGMFVFESKNYSGWIFGNEQQVHWYQTLPSGRKSRKQQFYNPIMQNNTHIKFLKALLGKDLPMHSVIVFSERCTLKNVQLQSKNIQVINRQRVKEAVAHTMQFCQEDLLDEAMIADIYAKLYPYTQVDQRTKQKHIENIQNSIGGQTTVATAAEETVLQETVEDVAEAAPAEPVEQTEKPEHAVVQQSVVADVVPLNFEIPAEEIPQPQICPWCRGELVLRTVGKGANIGKKFYGCSNFPKCRYVKNIADGEVQS